MTELATRIDLLFHLFAAVVLFGSAVVLLHRWPVLGAGLVLGAVVLTTALRVSWLTAEVGVGGTVLTSMDVLALALLGVSAAAALSDGVNGRGHWIAWLLTGLLVVNVARGALSFGLQPALNEARPWFYLTAGLLYALSRPVTRVGWWTVALACTGISLAVLAAVGFAVTGVNSVTMHVQLNGQLVDPRPVTATGALIVVEGMLLIAAHHSGRRLVRLAVVAILAGTVVLLQHRTLWVGCAVALCYLGTSGLRAGGRRRLAALVAATGAVVAAVLVVSSGLLSGSVLAQSVANATQADNTFAWRLLGWRELVAGHSDPSTLLLGDPFGTGYARNIGGQIITVSPHSQYVETFLRFGLVGLVLLASIVVLIWRHADAGARTFGVRPAVMRTTLLVVLIYGVTYRWDAVQALLLGVVLQAGGPARALRRSGPTRPVPVAVGPR